MRWFKLMGYVLLIWVVVGCVELDSPFNPPEIPPSFDDLPQYINWTCQLYCQDLLAESYVMETTFDSEVTCACYRNQKEIGLRKIAIGDDPIQDMFSHNTKEHWTHMPLTVSIDEHCGDYESRQIIRATKRIENVTDGKVAFVEVEENADITFECSYLEDCYIKETEILDDRILTRESICAHTRGLATITRKRGPQIINAHIEMIGLDGFSETRGKEMSGFFIGTCGHTDTEVHEILHVFGYGHVNNERSIMADTEDSYSYTLGEENECLGSAKTIDSSIKTDLSSMYASQQNSTRSQ